MGRKSYTVQNNHKGKDSHIGQLPALNLFQSAKTGLELEHAEVATVLLT